MSAVLWIGGAVVVGGAFITGGWLIGTYNRFVIAFQDVKEQWHNIKTEYQRRADLIVNLVESVKSYKKFERSTLKEVVQARSGSFGDTKQQQMATMKQVDSFLARLMVVVERYPKLRSAVLHKELMGELTVTENRINAARTEYNSVVNDYNILVRTFPNNLLAGLFHFELDTYFENEEGTDKAPKINLG